MAQVAKNASAFGDFVPQSPHQSFAHGPHWYIRGDFRNSDPPVSLAALSGSECLSCSLSLRLCFSNDVSEAWIHGWMSG